MIKKLASSVISPVEDTENHGPSHAWKSPFSAQPVPVIPQNGAPTSRFPINSQNEEKENKAPAVAQIRGDPSAPYSGFAFPLLLKHRSLSNPLQPTTTKF